MTPDELVVIMLERLAKAKVDFTVESYGTTRVAAERLLRTVGAVPEEPPKAIESAPTIVQAQAAYVAPHPALKSNSLGARTQLLPVYRRGHGKVYSGS